VTKPMIYGLWTDLRGPVDHQKVVLFNSVAVLRCGGEDVLRASLADIPPIWSAAMISGDFMFLRPPPYILVWPVDIEECTANIEFEGYEKLPDKRTVKGALIAAVTGDYRKDLCWCFWQKG